MSTRHVTLDLKLIEVMKRKDISLIVSTTGKILARARTFF
jgi:hypothetical protein